SGTRRDPDPSDRHRLRRRGGPAPIPPAEVACHLQRVSAPGFRPGPRHRLAQVRGGTALGRRPARRRLPPRPLAPNVDVDERPVYAVVPVDPGTPDQLGVPPLYRFDGFKDNARIARVATAVAIQVVHVPVAVVVDPDVRRVAVLMTAQRGASLVEPLTIVLRRPVAAHDDHLFGADPARVQLLHDELELVQEERVDHYVFRPDVVLVLGQELAEREVLREPERPILRRDLDEALRR